jgi:hypothetical protein
MALTFRKYIWPTLIARYDGTNSADILALLPPYVHNGVTYPRDVQEANGVLTFVLWMPWGFEETITFNIGDGVGPGPHSSPESLMPTSGAELNRMTDVTDV